MLPLKIKNLKKIEYKGFNVPKFIYFTEDNYKKNKFKIFNNISKKFKKKIIIFFF